MDSDNAENTQGVRPTETSGNAGSPQNARSNADMRCRRASACPQDVLLASTTLALTLSRGRSRYEIETLINLFSLTTDNLQAILAQMLINEKVQQDLEIPL